jgi:hypothetical protein
MEKIFSINNKKANCTIKVKLADDCKNGHEDFSLTGTFWEIGKVRSDRNMISGGCCHDEIIEIMPELKIFEQLHNSDYNGYPMHCVSNMYYKLQKSPNTFCESYSITEEQFNTIASAQNELHFAYLLINKSDILQTYSERAKKAILILEELTDTKFVSQSTKSNLKSYDFSSFEGKSIEQIKQEQETKEKAIKAQKIDDKISEIKEEEKRDIKKIKFEASLKIDIINILGTLNTNYSFYNSTNRLVFNWQDYGDEFTHEQIATFIREYKNPKNIGIEAKGN